MSGVINLLEGDSADFLTGIGDWAVDYGDVTLSHSFVRVAREGVGSLKAVMGSLSAGSIQIAPAVSVPEDYAGWPIRYSVLVYHEANTNIEITLTYICLNPITSESSSEYVTFPTSPYKWTYLSIEEEVASTTIGDSNFVIAPYLYISNHNTNDVVYFCQPNLSMPLAVTDNNFAAETWARLPQYMKDADRTQESPDFPLLRFIDIATHEAGKIFNTWDDIRYIPPDDADMRESALVDPWTAEPEWLPWLAQFMGIMGLSSASDGFTSWAGLIEGLDADLDGSAEWSEWQTEADTGDPGTDVSWEELEQFNPSLSAATLVQFMRWQISTAAFALKGGTTSALKEAAKLALTGDQYVDVIPMADGNPWLIRLVVSALEAPDTASVTTAVAEAVPAGFRVDCIFGPAGFNTIAAVARVNDVTVSVT